MEPRGAGIRERQPCVAPARAVASCIQLEAVTKEDGFHYVHFKSSCAERKFVNVCVVATMYGEWCPAGKAVKINVGVIPEGTKLRYTTDGSNPCRKD